MKKKITEIFTQVGKRPRNKTYTIAMTSMFGTYIAGKYRAKNGGGACSKARKENGPEWTYYIWKKTK